MRARLGKAEGDVDCGSSQITMRDSEGPGVTSIPNHWLEAPDEINLSIMNGYHRLNIPEAERPFKLAPRKDPRIKLGQNLDEENDRLVKNYLSSHPAIRQHLEKRFSLTIKQFDNSKLYWQIEDYEKAAFSQPGGFARSEAAAKKKFVAMVERGIVNEAKTKLFAPYQEMLPAAQGYQMRTIIKYRNSITALKSGTGFSYDVFLSDLQGNPVNIVFGKPLPSYTGCGKSVSACQKKAAKQSEEYVEIAEARISRQAQREDEHASHQAAAASPPRQLKRTFSYTELQ